jgi:magnesium and cobalt exporter, CNNM family
MTITSPLTWLILPLCLTLSFLLSGMEAGVFALSRLRVRRLMRAGRSSARLLSSFLDNPENFLWTILVGNTTVNFVVLAWTVPLLYELLKGQGTLFAFVFACIVFLFYAFFDLLPKMLFRAYPNRLCMYFAKPYKFVHLALRPLVMLVEGSSGFLLHWTGGKAFTGRLFGNREELRQVMQETAQSLTTEERGMISRVLDLQALTVREITTPIAEALIVGSQVSTGEVLVMARDGDFTHLPVREMRDGQQKIIGILSLDSLLYEAELDTASPVAKHVRPALCLEEDMRLEVAMRKLQRGGQQLAVVLDRNGQEAGIMGLADILRVVFGEFRF